MWDWVVEHAAEEWRVVTGAPIAALMLCAIGGTVAYFLQEQRYSALRERIIARDERILRLKEQLDTQPQPVQPVATPEMPERKAPSLEDKIRPGHPSRWSPDMTIKEAASHILGKTYWRPQYGNVSELALASEIHTALYQGKLSGWAKLHPDGEEVQVSTWHWNHCDLTRLDGYAFLRLVKTPIYDIRLARGEVETCWPTTKG